MIENKDNVYNWFYVHINVSLKLILVFLKVMIIKIRKKIDLFAPGNITGAKRSKIVGH